MTDEPTTMDRLNSMARRFQEHWIIPVIGCFGVVATLTDIRWAAAVSLVLIALFVGMERLNGGDSQ